MPIEQQQRRQRPPRLDQIGQRISVQDSEKRLNRIVQHAAQHADALDRAIIAPPQTADNIELVLRLAHHLADIDVARRAWFGRSFEETKPEAIQYIIHID